MSRSCGNSKKCLSFTDHDREGEFGGRCAHRRALRPAHLEKLADAAGTKSLDATTYGDR